MNKFMIYDESYEIDSIETTLNIDPDYAEAALAREIEHTNREKGFWAVIIIGGIENRYRMIDDKFVNYMTIER